MVFYIGSFKASIMDAQCQLVLGNCEVLRSIGYNVVLIGNDSALAHQNDVLQSKTYIEGFEFYNVSFHKCMHDLLHADDLHADILKILACYSQVDIVICYGSPAFAIEIGKLAKWCRKYKVVFLSNCVDLSSQSHGNFVQRVIKRIDRYYRDQVLRNETDGIIAVSSFIAEYYEKGKQHPIVIIPPLKDTRRMLSPVVKTNSRTTLVYIGVPFPIDGRRVDVSAYKDRIDLLIEQLCSIRDKAEPFQFDLYGLSKAQYLHVVPRHSNLLKKNSDIVFFHGYIDHEEALETVRKADYSVLYRERNQMTMAGFSSKLVESISCGTPVILSDTSDYAQYLKDGKMCYFIDINNSDNAKATLIKALNVGRKEITAMKKACYESRVFDYRNFVAPMRMFLQSVKRT